MTWLVWIGFGVIAVLLFVFFQRRLSDQSMQGLNTLTMVTEALDGITLRR